MADAQILFPMKPKEFWQKLKVIVEQIVIEHNKTVPLLNPTDKKCKTAVIKGY